MQLGYKQPLQDADVWQLDPSDRTGAVSDSPPLLSALPKTPDLRNPPGFALRRGLALAPRAAFNAAGSRSSVARRPGSCVPCTAASAPGTSWKQRQKQSCSLSA
eukprot:SM003376S12987  [mRNA]  locus=s3376:163:528:- [translate_table: standard]